MQVETRWSGGKTWVPLEVNFWARFRISLSLNFLISRQMSKKQDLTLRCIGIIGDNANEFLVKGLLAPDSCE
jgi:hypothetical protein